MQGRTGIGPKPLPAAIGEIDFELGTPTRIHQAVYDAIPTHGVIGYVALMTAYDDLDRAVQLEASLEEALTRLEAAGFVKTKPMGGTTYITRRRWL